MSKETFEAKTGEQPTEVLAIGAGTKVDVVMKGLEGGPAMEPTIKRCGHVADCQALFEDEL